jgi:hypothetical protein
MKFLNLSSRLCVLFCLSVALAACGGGEQSGTPTVSAAVPQLAAVATIAGGPTQMTADAVTVIPTTGEVLDSLKETYGSIVDSDSSGTFAIAPGQTNVTLTAFSRVEKYKEYIGAGHQGVTQLVFINRSDTNMANVVDSGNVRLKFGGQDLYDVAPYYTLTWKNDTGSGLIVTFLSAWYGQVPLNGIVDLFSLEANYIKMTATRGMTVDLELINVETGNTTVKYEVGPVSTKRILVVDPDFIPVYYGKG